MESESVEINQGLFDKHGGHYKTDAFSNYIFTENVKGCLDLNVTIPELKIDLNGFTITMDENVILYHKDPTRENCEEESKNSYVSTINFYSEISTNVTVYNGKIKFRYKVGEIEGRFANLVLNGGDNAVFNFNLSGVNVIDMDSVKTSPRPFELEDFETHGNIHIHL